MSSNDSLANTKKNDSKSRSYPILRYPAEDDYTAFRFEIFNCIIWAICLLAIYILFNNHPYLFKNPSPSNDIWLKITSSWPYDIRLLYGLLNYIFVAMPFFAVCIYFDILYKYNIFTSYRIQTPYNKYPPSQLVSDAIKYDLRLLLIYVPISICFTFNFDDNFSAIPNVWIICKHLLLSIYTFDIGFYLTHRMLHCHPWFYQYHKQHHEFKVSISWTATYSSLFELIVGNVPPTVLPIIIFKLHPVTTLIFYTYRNIETATTHSGYDVPFYLSPLGILKFLPGHYLQERLHDFHHSHNDGCFGFYFIDMIFGTHTKFRQYYFDSIHKKKN